MEKVFTVTDASDNGYQDQKRRMRAYLIGMSVRSLCFVLAVLFRDSWLALAFIAAAILLPFPLVILANVRGDAEAGKLESPLLALGSKI